MSRVEKILLIASVLLLAFIACTAKTNEPVKLESTMPLALQGMVGVTNSPQSEADAKRIEKVRLESFREGAYFAIIAAKRNPDVNDMNMLVGIAWALREQQQKQASK